MQTIQLEAFHSNLHGCRILCQGPFPKGPPIMESIQRLREPFKKKILLSHTVFGLSKMLPLQYDAVFQVKDTPDWTLILTYVTYAPKPLLIVSEDLVIPDGLWSKLPQMVTFVNLARSSVLNVRPYDAIFFAAMEEPNTSYEEYSCKTLQVVYRASYSAKEHREIVQELRVAGAGLVWCKEEKSLGWYDPTTNQGDPLSAQQLSDLFGILSEQFRS
jgi:hypothetical protein